MAKLTITKIVRAGKKLLPRGDSGLKYQSSVETSNGHLLKLFHGCSDRPYVGMELDMEDFKSKKSELRPLRKGDKWPEVIPAVDVLG